MSGRNIELRSLRHIVEVAESLNYTRAAEELGITQSALSRSIQTFEQQYGVRLFDRNRGGVALTAIGSRFVARAKQLLLRADDLQNALQLETSATAGEVAFGMAPMPAKALLAPVLHEVLQSSPDLVTQVTVRRAEALTGMLQAGRFEFFVCAEGQVPDTAPLRGISLGRCSLALLVRPGHPALKKRLGKARSFPLLLPDRLRGAIGERFKAIAALSGPQHLVEDYATAATITGQTDAIWIASDIAAATETAAGRLVKMPQQNFELPVEHYRVMLYSLSLRTLSPAALRMKSILQEQMRHLSGQ